MLKVDVNILNIVSFDILSRGSDFVLNDTGKFQNKTNFNLVRVRTKHHLQEFHIKHNVHAIDHDINITSQQISVICERINTKSSIIWVIEAYVTSSSAGGGS